MSEPGRGGLDSDDVGELRRRLDAAVSRVCSSWSRADQEDLVQAAMLKLMALESAGNTLVTDYSHGMRKKLSLAAALLPAPRLLFLDEPFEGIDAVASRQIKDLLLSFVARGGTIFLTSHILEIVERLSTHLGVIVQGKLVAQGPVAELRATSGQTLEELFIGLVGGEARTSVALDWI